MMKTLLLDKTAWDLVLDTSGNIALARNPYSIAQDVSSAVKTFIGECWYNTELGIPYWENILGEYPSISYVKQQLIDAAFTVPEVVEADVVMVSFDGRNLTGQIKIIDKSGQESGVTF